jgi:hypothetical protein
MKPMIWLRNLFVPRVYGPAPIVHITKATPIGSYRLQVTFSNLDVGEIDLANHVAFRGILAPLADYDFFRQVFVARGTLCWPGDIDMDSTVIHHLTMGLRLSSSLASDRHFRSAGHLPAPTSTEKCRFSC